ncbi:MAG: heavy metal translocating P-type ATPase, partial [Variovorax sp.]|nr:heavy metal translocating P-type ATPase [Variovorax sp.]
MQAVLPFTLAGHAAQAPGEATPQGEWSLLDDPAEWGAFGRALDAGDVAGRWESQVRVEGMHCAACAFTVEAALAQLPGV